MATSFGIWKKRICAALFMGVVSTQAAFAVPVLSIVATPNPAVAASTVAVNVLITGIADLYGYQFNLSFNPAVLQATSITEGAFLASGGNTFFSGGTVNNVAGTVSNSFDALTGAVPGVSGSGTLARINFNVTRAGSSSFTLSNVLFVDSNGNDIAVQVANQTLQAVPEPTSLALFAAGLAGLLAWRCRAVQTRAPAIVSA